MKKTYIILTIFFLFCYKCYSQGITFYEYNFPIYNEIEKPSSIKDLDAVVLSQNGTDLNYSKIGSSNIINSNMVYYDVKNNWDKTPKIAIEVDWNKVDEIRIIINKDYTQQEISLFNDGADLNKPDNLLNQGKPGERITTHFILNRLKYYFKVQLAKRSDLNNLQKAKILDSTMTNVIFNAIPITLSVKNKGNQEFQDYHLIARNSGLTYQYQNKVILSLSYVNKDVIGNVFIGLPFRFRSKKPTAKLTDFRWVGDVVSFGPLIVVENVSTKPVGVGGFIGLGLSESGQMTLGLTGGVLFENGNPFYYGLSYNVIGFIDGLVDLFNGKPAWVQTQN